MRDKLVELLDEAHHKPLGKEYPERLGTIADHLIANGVTLQQWIPVSERLPVPFVSVLVQMPDEEPCPTVREGFLTSNGDWYAGYFTRPKDEVTHWMPMPEPPKEGE